MHSGTQHICTQQVLTYLYTVYTLVDILVETRENEISTADICKSKQALRTFSLADIQESAQTGATQQSSLVLPPETSNWCNNHANMIYRTYDGTCNHPNNFGAASKNIDRLLPPAYDDGFDSPRQRGTDGLPLPSARNVSLKVHPPRNVFAGLPILVMQWGQWIAHDVVATATSNGNIDCCGPNGGCQSFTRNARCFPIQVPPNDPTLPGICLDFLRSIAANGSDNLPARPRQQINTVTSFIDCSQIYGSSDDVAASVREPNGFLLRTKNDFPPESNGACIKRPGTDDYCFLAGDARANQHPYLSAMHTLWLREHNRIAKELRALKPGVPNEDIYQLTRKITIGMHHVITYNSYLPVVLGNDADRWLLTCRSERSIYNPGLNPSVFHEFSTAAFRAGHSTIPSNFPIGYSTMPLRFMFNRPYLAIEHFNSIIAGMVGKSTVSNVSIQGADRFFSQEVSRSLFFNNNTGRGIDLVSINIQRERDHGLPPYVMWRSFCGLRPLTGFNDTEALGPDANELSKVYRSINDIDLYTGMLFEPVDTGIFGPTIRCLLRIQFFRTKYGDRFFFCNTETNSGFTDGDNMDLLARTAGDRGNERADNLASKATINGPLTMGTTDILQTMRDNLMKSEMAMKYSYLRERTTCIFKESNPLPSYVSSYNKWKDSIEPLQVCFQLFKLVMYKYLYHQHTDPAKGNYFSTNPDIPCELLKTQGVNLTLFV